MSAWWHRFIPGKRHQPKPEQPGTDALAPKGRIPEHLRRVTVGLDFGTSTTKCCFREDADQKPFVLVGYDAKSHVLFPSTIAFEGGRLLFGHDAEIDGSSTVIRSFKMCLLCQARKEACQNNTEANTCPNCLKDRPGYFLLGSKQVSAETLSILYLAVVLGAAKERVAAAFGVRQDQIRYVINSAAPLDQMSEFGEVGEYFENALYYGWLLADVSKQAWLLDDAIAALERNRLELRPPVEESPTRVFPETHAAMTAYLLLPQSESGLYGLVDIGAGTTDVAFFWLQKDDERTTAWYYSAGSRRIGMDDVDYALAVPLGIAPNVARAAREALSEVEIDAHDSLIKPIASRIYQHQAVVLDDAMRIDQRPRAWFNKGKALYKLFLVGGGSICTPVTERMKRDPPRHMSRWEEPPSQLAIPGRTSVMLPTGETVPLKSLQEPHSARLLLLACGLAFRRPDIPKYERDTEGVKIVLREREVPDEFTGHWW